MLLLVTLMHVECDFSYFSQDLIT
uniref:Uncharacterized protein n=1 Tax=Arundo donax TaxID=35708 RepID=A0A0A9CDB1_ARUDO